MRPKLRAAAFEVGDLEAGKLRDGLAFDDGVQRRRGDPSAHAVLPPDGSMMAVLMLIRSPRRLISAPPELPGLLEASVWMKSS